jgi:hypothetical protein
VFLIFFLSNGYFFLQTYFLNVKRIFGPFKHNYKQTLNDFGVFFVLFLVTSFFIIIIKNKF